MVSLSTGDKDPGADIAWMAKWVRYAQDNAMQPHYTVMPKNNYAVLAWERYPFIGTDQVYSRKAAISRDSYHTREDITFRLPNIQSAQSAGNYMGSIDSLLGTYTLPLPPPGPGYGLKNAADYGSLPAKSLYSIPGQYR